MLGECMAFWGEPNQPIATANTVVINQMLTSFQMCRCTVSNNMNIVASM